MRAVMACLSPTISEGLLFSKQFHFLQNMNTDDTVCYRVSLSLQIFNFYRFLWGNICRGEMHFYLFCKTPQSSIISTSWVLICLCKNLHKILSPNKIRTAENINMEQTENHSPLKIHFFILRENALHEHRNSFQHHFVSTENPLSTENGS